MHSSYCTYHNSSRALETRELITDIIAKFFLSSYISLDEFTAILTALRMLGCHLVPDFWQCFGGFLYLVKFTASLADIRNLLLESFDDDDISENEFLLLCDANTSIDLSVWDGRQRVFGWVSFPEEWCSRPFRGLPAPSVFHAPLRIHLWWNRNALYNTETICLPMQIHTWNFTIWSPSSGAECEIQPRDGYNISRAQSQTNSVE